VVARSEQAMRWACLLFALLVGGCASQPVVTCARVVVELPNERGLVMYLRVADSAGIESLSTGDVHLYLEPRPDFECEPVTP
jgi:hypothetical protein